MFIAFGGCSCSVFQTSKGSRDGDSDSGVTQKFSSLWSNHRLVTRGELPFEFCVEFAKLPGPCHVYKLSSGFATSDGGLGTCRIEVKNSAPAVALFADGFENRNPEKPLIHFFTEAPMRGDETTLVETSQEPLYGKPVTWIVSDATCAEFIRRKKN